MPSDGRGRMDAPRALASAVTASMLLASTAPLAAQVPGLGDVDFVVAGVVAGDDSVRVRALLSGPDSVTTSWSQLPPHQWAAMFYGNSQVDLADGEVVGWRLRDSGLATARGARVGDHRSEVVRLYGPPTVERDGRLYYLGERRRLRFELEGELVVMVSVEARRFAGEPGAPPGALRPGAR